MSSSSSSVNWVTRLCGMRDKKAEPVAAVFSMPNPAPANPPAHPPACGQRFRCPQILPHPAQQIQQQQEKIPRKSFHSNHRSKSSSSDGKTVDVLIVLEESRVLPNAK
jgi:hypothetical protein